MGRRAASWKRTVASALASWPGIVAAVAASNGGLVVGVRRLAVALFVAMLRLRKTVLSRTQGIVLGSVTSYAGKHFAQYVELLRWRRRVFYHRVHVVLLSWDPVADASFRIEKRTLLEGSLEDSILNGNHAAAKLCSGAAARCSAARPFVTQHLPSEERYQLLNNALNLISSLTPAGHIAEDIYPASTVGCWYVFGLTVDKYASPDRPETPDSKIRLTLVKEQVLLWICDPCHTAAVEFADQVFRYAIKLNATPLYNASQISPGCLPSASEQSSGACRGRLVRGTGQEEKALTQKLVVPTFDVSTSKSPNANDGGGGDVIFRNILHFSSNVFALGDLEATYFFAVPTTSIVRTVVGTFS
ncbi:Hypothetical Protein FCC1311_076392 [Hondaea fermentalgiana]|uniref:Uncharacterized protein n=1 Tax=Hondaea fermentalgiana TaxID=2315210 RepID=A0A2R5GLA4_9STRA|nr:Hypothetical Protein FCC1311_076392 [Hondaea fermentalgiana]|eukprot:GBG31415.1 Hypothetical Protein FCC1311_076392 [Hondaea fermentalgiana]